MKQSDWLMRTQIIMKENTNNDCTSITSQTLAVITVELIDAYTTISARITRAFVHVNGTLWSCPSWFAGAIIASRLFGNKTSNEWSKESKRYIPCIKAYTYIWYMYYTRSTISRNHTHIIVASGSLFAR